MNTVAIESGSVRPSRLVAEALVMRQEPEVVQARAREMGLCEDLTQAVVRVCCHERDTAEVGTLSARP